MRHDVQSGMLHQAIWVGSLSSPSNLMIDLRSANDEAPRCAATPLSIGTFYALEKDPGSPDGERAMSTDMGSAVLRCRATAVAACCHRSALADGPRARRRPSCSCPPAGRRGSSSAKVVADSAAGAAHRGRCAVYQLKRVVYLQQQTATRS